MTAWRGTLRRLGSFASRRMVVWTSAAFALATGLAIYLVTKSAQVMRDRIGYDFNEQQLILARQAATQIDARLRGMALELDGVRRYLRAAGREHLELVGGAALERGAPAGMRSLALLDASGRIVWSWGPGDATPVLAGLAPQCVGAGAADGRLAPLTTRSVEGHTRLESVLCSRLEGGAVAALVDVSRLVGGVTGGIRSGRTGYAWAIDDHGIFLAHADGDFAGRDAFAARHERRPYISFSAINAIMKDRMLRGVEGTGTYVSGWHRGVQGEIVKLIAFTPVRSEAVPAGAVWSVAVVAPTDEVADAVNSIYARQLLTQAALLAALGVFAATAVVYQRRLSRALRADVDRQQEYISSLLKSSMDAIIFVDNDNMVAAWNRGAEHIFGYTAEEMVGHTLHQLIPPELNADAELSRIRMEVQQKGYMRNYVATRRTKDGRRITIDLSRTLVRDRQGNSLGGVVIIKDITEKIELDQLIYSTEKLASIGTLAAGVAHEINNPLAVILGFADLLLERLPKDSQEYEDVKLIEYNANHARKVVQDMLGFARVTEGLEDTADVLAALDVVLTISQSTFVTRKIEVARELPEELPRARGDPRELQQVILNLVSNAVAAMPAGGRLTAAAWEDDGGVHFAVGDTGAGIPERIKPRIFDPFFTTKKLGEGTGLGLSLCYGIVSKYGGKIAFTSTAREESGGKPSGTTFTVTMPVARGEAEGAVA